MYVAFFFNKILATNHRCYSFVCAVTASVASSSWSSCSYIYGSVLQRASRKHLVCMRTRPGSKTLWNWLPIQFTGGRKRKRCFVPFPALSYDSFNLLSYSLSLSIFITRWFVQSVGFVIWRTTGWYLTLTQLYIIRAMAQFVPLYLKIFKFYFKFFI